MSQFHDSLTYLDILLKKNLTQWSDTINATNLGFSEPDPWHSQSNHKALVVQEVLSHSGKTQKWDQKLSEQKLTLSETGTGQMR